MTFSFHDGTADWAVFRGARKAREGMVERTRNSASFEQRPVERLADGEASLDAIRQLVRLLARQAARGFIRRIPDASEDRIDDEI